METRDLIIIVYAFFGLLLAGLSIPMVLRRVPPNPFYGFRVPKTMNNPDIWYEINAYAGWWLLGAGLGAAVIAGIVYVALPGLDKDLTASILGVGALVPLLIAVTASFNKLKTL